METSTHTAASLSSGSPPSEVEHIKVFLRLRPKNKLETMKRSKDCIQLHENPMDITVESPLLGEYQFSFDQVFDEFASQEEVYRECLSGFPQKLMQGVNVTAFAYGPRGTGKTYTLLGEGRGLNLVALASNNSTDDTIIYEQSDNSESVNREFGHSAPLLDRDSSHLDPGQNPETTGGMIPRLVGHLFNSLYQSTPTDSSVEYTVRCSYVEIYLEKMTDLLHPRGEVSGLRIGRMILDKTDEDSCILGAIELCCLCAADVYTLLARGQARRTKSADDANVDSSRSYAVFTLKLEQTDVVTGKVTRSRLQVIDCAGSETKPTSKTPDTATATEGNMINASLKSFHNVVLWTLQQQEERSKTYDELPSRSLSKIANLMKASIGGRTHTVMICTGAPSSYSIDETIQAIRFAQLVRQVRNRPRAAFEDHSFQLYRSKLLHAERREEQLTQLILMIAQESKHGKKKTREPKNPMVWEAILQICDADKKKQKKNGSDSKKKQRKDKSGDGDLCISLYSESEQQAEIQDLYSRVIEIESKFQQERTAREKAEARNRDVRSELAALKYQNESLLRDKRKLETQLNDAKAESKSVYLQKTEVEHRLRTSEFRESEAVLFLRQLRTFYCRLLKNKAAHGNGSTREVIQEAKKRIPGVADLEALLDVDKMMVQSGIIESSEIGGDTLVSDYSPSDEARAKSSMEAEMAEKREINMIYQQLKEDNGLIRTTQDIASITKDQSSANFLLTYGQLAACRQKLLCTPAGLLALQKERELEQELTELSKKCAGLHNSLNAEKAMVEALSGRIGAVNKMKQAQEVVMLKTELERRTNDLLAIVWKMNELHLVNKTIDTKVGTREQHVINLEQYVSESQAKAQSILSLREIREKKLREENSNLRSQLEGMALNLWQLGENLDKAPVWRHSVPCNGEDINLNDILERRQSTGDMTEEEIDDLVKTLQSAP